MLYGSNQSLGNKQSLIIRNLLRFSSPGTLFGVRPLNNKSLLYTLSVLGSVLVASSLLALGGVYFPVSNVPENLWIHRWARATFPAYIAGLI